jgi:hypothetical protein
METKQERLIEHAQRLVNASSGGMRYGGWMQWAIRFEE